MRLPGASTRRFLAKQISLHANRRAQREAIAANLFRIARAVDTLISDRREELRLKRQREDVVDAALDRERFNRADDRLPDAASVHVARHRDRRDFGDRRRILLQCAAADDVARARPSPTT